MLKKDSIWLGILLGLLVPVVLFAIVYFPMVESGRVMTFSLFENLSLFLIAANAVVMNWGFFQRERDQTGKGMFIITGLYALAYVTYFVILNG